jgi:uncharacterized membrane protein
MGSLPAAGDPGAEAAEDAPEADAPGAGADAAIAADAEAGPPRSAYCRGNEPFWHLRVSGGVARYAAMLAEPPERIFDVTLDEAALAMEREPVLAARWSGPERGDGGGRLRVDLVLETCRDSMSDETPPTPYRGEITLPGGRVLRGCCTTGRPPPPVASPLAALPSADPAALPEGSWARLSRDLAPALGACLAAAPGSAPRVSIAWPMNHGMAGARLRNAEGGWVECVAPLAGGEVDRLVPLAAGTPPLPAEDETLFSTPEVGPPAGDCQAHERLLDASGALLGYLTRPGGC